MLRNTNRSRIPMAAAALLVLFSNVTPVRAATITGPPAPVVKPSIDLPALERAVSATAASTPIVKTTVHAPKRLSTPLSSRVKAPIIAVTGSAATLPASLPGTSLPQPQPPSIDMDYSYSGDRQPGLGGQFWLYGRGLGGAVDGKLIVPTVEMYTDSCAQRTAVPVRHVAADGSAIEIDISNVRYAPKSGDAMHVSITTPLGHTDSETQKFYTASAQVDVSAVVPVSGGIDPKNPLFKAWTYTITPDIGSAPRVYLGTKVNGQDTFTGLPTINGYTLNGPTYNQNYQGGMGNGIMENAFSVVASTYAGYSNYGQGSVSSDGRTHFVQWLLDQDHPYVSYTEVEHYGGPAGFRAFSWQPKLGGPCEQ